MSITQTIKVKWINSSKDTNYQNSFKKKIDKLNNPKVTKKIKIYFSLPINENSRLRGFQL